MATVTVSEARASLPDLLNRVADGEEVVITRHGKPVAIVVRPDALRSRRADEAIASGHTVRVLLDDGRQSKLGEGKSLSAERADALLSDVRLGRKGR